MRKIGGLWPLLLWSGCGYLTIYMQTVPANDPGRFNITIDGAVRATDQGNGGVVSQVKLSTGNHTIGQTAGTNTQLADYKTVISGDCDANGKTLISYADDKSCTITNTNARFLSATGPQRTVIILANAPGAGVSHPYANKTNTASLFYASGNPASARSYFQGASWGQMRITGANPGADGTTADIFGPYTTPDDSCGADPLALADAAIDFNKYDRMVLLVNNPKCASGGLGQVGPSIWNTGEGLRLMTLLTVFNNGFGETTLNGKIGNAAVHEFGHNLGLQHGGAWYCPAAPVAANGCHGNDKWDPIELVSQGSRYPHPNPIHKERLGWLGGARVQTVGSGNFVLNAYEDATNNLKVVKIPRLLPNGSGWYYLSYHHPSPPFDDWVQDTPTFANGVAVNTDQYGYGFDTGVLDATPGSQSSYSGYGDIRDGALGANQTLTDPLTGVIITVTNVTAQAATVSVTVPARTKRFVQAAMEINNTGNIPMSSVGSVAGGGAFTVGQMASLSATSQPGWGFSDWYDYATTQAVSSANPYAFSVAKDVVYTARFKAVAPPNDNFANAKPVTAPFQDHVFTASATSEAGEKYPSNVCGPGFLGGRTIWYTYTPGANGRLSVDTAGSDNATGVAVYTGNSLATLVAVPNACGLWAANTTDPHVAFQASAGTTYHVQVDNAGQNTIVTFALAPANDDFAAAKALGALPAQDTAALRGATFETNEPGGAACGQVTPEVTAWYSFTAAQTKSLVVSSSYGGALKSGSTQPGISVYTGAALGGLVAVGGGLCNSNPGNAQADFTVPVTAGTTYRVRISHFRNDVDPAATTTTGFQLQ